jgi:outer membrane protein
MKKTLSLVALFFVTNFAISQTKIAHVDSQKLLDTLSILKDIDKQLVDYQRLKQFEKDSLIKDFQTSQEKFEANSANLSPTMKKAKQSELQLKYENLQIIFQEMELEMQQEALKMQEPIFNLVKSAVKKVADQKKVDLVLNSNQQSNSGVLFASEAINITNEVAVELLKLEKEYINKKR